MTVRGPVSLRNRISLVLVAVVALALLGANVAVYMLASHGLDERVGEQLDRLSDFAETFAATTRGRVPFQPDQLPDLVTDPGRGDYVGIVDPDSGQNVDVFLLPDDTERQPPVLPPDLSPDPDEAAVLDTAAVIDGGRVPYRLRVTTVADGILVIAGIPTDDLAHDRRSLARLQIAAGLTVLVLLALLTRWLVGVGLRPLSGMERAAERIAGGDLSQRVEPSDTRSEISRLGAALNRMLAEIERAFATKERSEQRLVASQERLRRFVADASHELRTPLTSIRGYAQLLRRDRIADADERTNAAGRIETEAARLGALVDDLLVLARLDEDAPLDSATLDVNELVGGVVDDARVIDPGRVISFEVRGAVALAGDRDGLTRVLTNLVANARQHTPAGTPIGVIVHDSDGAPGDRTGNVVIDVIDHGQGISPEVRPQLFNRFYRADPSRSRDRGGAGLGLAIVAGIVGAHGGRCEVIDTPGGGATFRIILPSAVASESA